MAFFVAFCLFLIDATIITNTDNTTWRYQIAVLEISLSKNIKRMSGSCDTQSTSNQVVEKLCDYELEMSDYYGASTEETDFVGMEQLEFVDFKQKYVTINTS